jgi:ribonuclease P protein component
VAIGREQRIRDSSEFRGVLRRGRRLDGRLFVLYLRRNARPAARLGLSVGRRVGSAVRRNRVKRLLRVAFAETTNLQVPVDVVVVPKPEIVGHGLEEIRAELQRRIHG